LPLLVLSWREAILCTMLTLSLLRHAKSSWSEGRRKDLERPLSARGERDAPRMGDFMAREGLVPDLILCSPAVRTRQTLDLVLPRLVARLQEASPEVEYDDVLYLGTPAAMRKQLSKIVPSIRHILLVGHNPGLQALALELLGEGDEQALEGLAEKLPTAGLVVIELDVVSWAKVKAGAGRLRLFTAPKRLD
jgi:phosphohistidine phosphatase